MRSSSNKYTKQQYGNSYTYTIRSWVRWLILNALVKTKLTLSWSDWVNQFIHRVSLKWIFVKSNYFALLISSPLWNICKFKAMGGLCNTTQLHGKGKEAAETARETSVLSCSNTYPQKLQSNSAWASRSEEGFRGGMMINDGLKLNPFVSKGTCWVVTERNPPSWPGESCQSTQPEGQSTR